MKYAFGIYQSRALALTLLVACLALLVIVVRDSLEKLHSHYDSAMETALDRLTRYQRIIAMGPEVEARIADVNQKNGLGNYLKSTSPALAAEEIQQVAQKIFETVGLKVESTQIAPHHDEGGYRKIVVNYKLKGSHLLVERLFYLLETYPKPLFFIDNLSIQSGVYKAFAPIHGVEPEVIVQFDLYAYTLVKKPLEIRK